MAKTANDGTQFTNQMQVNSRNASLANKATDKPDAQPDAGSDPMSDPDVQNAIEVLKSKGVTEEEVEQAMGWSQEQPANQDSNTQAVQAAPLQIPGM